MSRLTPAMQKAAVNSALAEGKTIEEVRKNFPELAEGLKLIEAEQKKPPRRRGSGPAAPVAVRPPRGL